MLHIKEVRKVSICYNEVTIRPVTHRTRKQHQTDLAYMLLVYCVKKA